jgi:hypothetical protein
VSASARAPAAVTANRRPRRPVARHPARREQPLRLEPVERGVDGADGELAPGHALELAAHVHPERLVAGAEHGDDDLLLEHA